MGNRARALPVGEKCKRPRRSRRPFSRLVVRQIPHPPHQKPSLNRSASIGAGIYEPACDCGTCPRGLKKGTPFSAEESKTKREPSEYRWLLAVPVKEAKQLAEQALTE